MVEESIAFVIAFGVLLFAFSLISRKISESMVTGPMIFVTAGVLLSPEVLGLVKVSSGGTFVLSIAELALVLTLFSDASRIKLQSLLREMDLPNRLLFLGLPLTIALGTIVAFFLLKDLTLAEAGLISAILSSTDMGPAQAVLNNTKVPVRIRQTLDVESGLNDGGVIPLFLFFLIQAGEEKLEPPIWDLTVFAFERIGLGILVGAAIGYAGGWLSNRAIRAGWMSGLYRKIGFMFLAIISWLVADVIGGSGFIAAFTGGVVSRAASNIEITEEERILAKAEGSIMSLAVYFIFGVTLAIGISTINWPIFIYAVLSLTVIRIIPLAISLIGTKLYTESILFLGWFGPRGITSVVLLLTAMEELGVRGIETVRLVVVTTVFLSVFAHGITSSPASEWYARVVAGLPSDSPERRQVK